MVLFFIFFYFYIYNYSSKTIKLTAVNLAVLMSDSKCLRLFYVLRSRLKFVLKILSQKFKKLFAQYNNITHFYDHNNFIKLFYQNNFSSCYYWHCLALFSNLKLKAKKKAFFGIFYSSLKKLKN